MTANTKVQIFSSSVTRRVMLFAALAFLGAGCDALTGASNVEYRISGSAAAVSITYENGSGTSQVSNASLPWSYSLKAKKGDFLYVSAQIVQGSGGISVYIYKNGDIFKSASASGFASIATASGGLD